MSQIKKEAYTVQIVKRLEGAYPAAHIVLNYGSTLELLITVILSAQCTDVKVNQVSASLFKKYRTINDYADADQSDLEQAIRPTGFFRNKAKNIMGAARKIREDYSGEVPHTMAEIITLPGVARKTGNIVLYNAYGITAGIAVDTHVGRLSRRLGLSRENDPVKVERDLMALLPKEKWGGFSYLLISHGRAVCASRKAKCADCLLKDICHSAFKV
ncbi:MAG: endonuclease III [Chloroflexi bacterium]|nr:endonuclease III [Chloroflexota bacterium]